MLLTSFLAFRGLISLSLPPLKKYSLYFMYIKVLSACMCAHHMHGPGACRCQKVSPGIGVIGVCESPCWYWKPNPFRQVVFCHTTGKLLVWKNSCQGVILPTVSGGLPCQSLIKKITDLLQVSHSFYQPEEEITER